MVLLTSWSRLKASVLHKFSKTPTVEQPPEMKTVSPIEPSTTSGESQASPTLPRFEFSSYDLLPERTPISQPTATRPFSSVEQVNLSTPPSPLNILQQPVSLGSPASPTFRQRNRNTIMFPISKVPPIYQPPHLPSSQHTLKRTICTGIPPKTPPLPNKNNFEELLDHFTLLHPLLYSSPSSMVYSVIKKSTLQVNTARIFKKTSSYESPLEYRKRLHKEIYITSQLDHPNILKLLDVCFHFNLPFVISEGGYFDGTGLLELSPLPLPNAICLLSDLLEGVNYLHTMQVAHLDLNLSNLVIFYNGTLKITNFSHATLINPQDKLPPLNFVYAKPHTFSSPELVGCNLDTIDMLSCDVWSAGIIGVLILTGHTPWPIADKEDPDFLQYMCSGSITTFTDTTASPYHKLLLGMLSINPQHRMTIAQALDFFIYLDNPAHTMLGDLATVYI